MKILNIAMIKILRNLFHEFIDMICVYIFIYLYHSS